MARITGRDIKVRIESLFGPTNSRDDHKRRNGLNLYEVFLDDYSHMPDSKIEMLFGRVRGEYGPEVDILGKLCLTAEEKRAYLAKVRVALESVF